MKQFKLETKLLDLINTDSDILDHIDPLITLAMNGDSETTIDEYLTKCESLTGEDYTSNSICVYVSDIDDFISLAY